MVTFGELTDLPCHRHCVRLRLQHGRNLTCRCVASLETTSRCNERNADHHSLDGQGIDVMKEKAGTSWSCRSGQTMWRTHTENMTQSFHVRGGMLLIGQRCLNGMYLLVQVTEFHIDAGTCFLQDTKSLHYWLFEIQALVD